MVFPIHSKPFGQLRRYMQKTTYIFSALGTLAIWVIAAFLIFFHVVIVSSVVDLLVVMLILFHATLSTAAIWWVPEVLRGLTDRVCASDPSTPASETLISSLPVKHSGRTIWWRLAFLSAVLNVITVPVWISLHFGNFPESFPIYLVAPMFGVLWMPVVYLSVFTLWHWRTRYAGRRHLGWLILFVITSWPVFQNLPGSVFVVLAYFVVHLIPDAQDRGIYATPHLIEVPRPASPLPQGYQLTKSACFVFGWSLVFGGILCAAVTCWVAFVIWNSFQYTIANETGNILSESMTSALWVAAQVAKITSVTCLLSALAVAVGAVLIQVSQRLRWRLLDELGRQKLLKSMQPLTPSRPSEGAPSGGG